MHLHKITPSIAKRMLAALKDDPEALAIVKPLTADVKHVIAAPFTKADLSAPDLVLCIAGFARAHVGPLPPLIARDGFAVEFGGNIFERDEYEALLAMHEARLAEMIWQAPPSGHMREEWIKHRMPWRFALGRDALLDVNRVFYAVDLASDDPKHPINAPQNARETERARKAFIARMVDGTPGIDGAVLALAWAERERARVVALEDEQPIGARLPLRIVKEDGEEEQLVMSALEGTLIDEARRALNARGKMLADGRAAWAKLAKQIDTTTEAAQ